VGHRASLAATRNGKVRKAMTPQEWSRIKEVLEVVLELEPSAHERYLDEVCASREEKESRAVFDREREGWATRATQP
jgi:hypothetical protein